MQLNQSKLASGEIAPKGAVWMYSVVIAREGHRFAKHIEPSRVIIRRHEVGGAMIAIKVDDDNNEIVNQRYLVRYDPLMIFDNRAECYVAYNKEIREALKLLYLWKDAKIEHFYKQAKKYNRLTNKYAIGKH